MAGIGDKIKTVVLLMFENRSFDHMLGHLPLEGINSKVDGLVKPLDKYSNIYEGDSYRLHEIDSDFRLSSDLPHEWHDVSVQLAKHSITKRYMMNGFVESYAEFIKDTPNPQCDPMSYFPSALVPISSFLANTYCACNRWFSSLPTSTQPNRTMAFFGDTEIFDTKTRLIGQENSIFDWLNRAGVRWRVYHDGVSFFTLYRSQWPHVFGPNFRDWENFAWDWKNESYSQAPQVILLEPSYDDSPHVGPDRPNDNHAPLAIGWGEDFLRRNYEAMIANPERMKETVFIVYYDEHGGFADHVPPPRIPYKTKGDEKHLFESLGPRIPGIIISPFVDEQSVSNVLFDHTSVLQLLAELYTPRQSYSDTVAERKNNGIASISQVLTRATPRKVFPPAPIDRIPVETELGKATSTKRRNEMAKSFELAARKMMVEEPSGVAAKYPELAQWDASIRAAGGKPIIV